MNKIIAASLLISLAFLFSCGGPEKAPSAPSPTPSQSVSHPPAYSQGIVVTYAPGERTKKLFSETLSTGQPVCIRLRSDIALISSEVETVELLVAIDGGNTATDFVSSLGHMGSVSTEGETRMLIHDAKMSVKSEVNPADIISGVGGKTADYYSSDKIRFTTGIEAIGDKRYDYDEMIDEDGHLLRVYYESGTDKWVFLRSNGQLITIIEYGNNPTPELFIIPKDYTETDLGALLGGLASKGAKALEGIDLPIPDGIKVR